MLPCSQILLSYILSAPEEFLYVRIMKCKKVSPLCQVDVSREIEMGVLAR